ncbi:cellulose binding domain-containing protein [Spirosoma radiotolerans]|uniref:cellulose binding domain-containing protein n=1 Tax=Spirosoma radiotolerans TaxID=1379870 RepID=UPI00130DBF3E|nr:cellulose binding domain-containing protein [Spirosoma radiotolerans]
MPLVWLSLLTVLLTLTRANAQNPCFSPTIPTISTTQTSICAGTSTILRIQSGSLNDATNWKWYSGSCGGTPAGTGSSIQVSPQSTTTYYVRGEGNCVTPGACASQQITVSAPFFPSLGNNGPLTCAKTSVTLTTNGGPSGATYTYSGGAQANSANPATATASQSGPYSVTVAVSGGCSAIATTTVTSNTVAPTVVVTPSSQTICSGQTATFTASGADTYTWSTGATTASTAASTPGSYSVTGTRASNGCSAMATGQLTVLPTPTLSLDNTRTSSSSRCDTPNGQIGFTTNVAGGDYSVSYRTSQLTDVQTKTVTVADSRFVLSGLSGGSYYGFSLTSAGCTGTNSVTVTLTNPVPPSVSISPASQTICQGQTANFTAQGGDAYSWSTGATTASLSVSVSGAYSVTATASNGCSATATASLTVNPLPMVYAVTGGGAYCAGSSGIGVGLSGSESGVNYQLQRDGNPVGSPLAGTGSALSFSPQTTGSYTVLATNASTSCQQAMNGSTTVTITPQPSAPMIVTQSGYAYPAGVSSLTIAQNVGPVSLTVAGCSGGMLMANGNAASSFTVSTAMTGTQTYTATCTQGGCTSPVGSFQLTVLPTTLSVLHQDVDYGQTQDQIIKPFLKLANAGGQPVPYGELTVRYWFTSEGNSPPTDFQLYYAQLGAVTMKYVPLAQPRQGAFGYVEYSFPGGGSLPANGNSGPIENGILKKDRSNFNETDDYSYQPNRDYLPNARITAYRNGVIVWGQEPTPVASQTAVQVYSAAKDGGITSQIQTRLELRNTGNVALPVSALKLRYYFTSDNGQTANVYVDYADLGASNVQARVVRLAAPVNGADSYVELSFPGNPRQLGPLSSLGVIDFRLVRSDFGLFNQGNDYSYAPIYGPVGLNNRVTVLLNNTLIFGTPPSGAPARVGAPEPVLALQAKVLGNPVVGSQAEVEITGVVGQAVTLRLVDLQGRTVHEQRIEQAGETELVSLPLGQSRGLLLLNVSTASQQQRLKLVRP